MYNKIILAENKSVNHFQKHGASTCSFLFIIDRNITLLRTFYFQQQIHEVSVSLVFRNN